MPGNLPDDNVTIAALLRTLGQTRIDLIRALTKIESLVADISQMRQE
jgi:hypothetical protein